MTNQDDFNLIDGGHDPDQNPRRNSNMMVWFIVALVLIIFGFAVGLAGVRLLTRILGNPDPTPVVAEIPNAEATSANTEPSPTASISAEESATATPSPGAPTPTTAGVTSTATATTVAPTATPAPVVCQYPVDPSLESQPGVGALGCPLAPPSADVWAAWEPFERGAMLWRSDNDQSYVFTSNGGWFPVTARWNGEPMASRGTPPPGLQEPQRGFGYVWGADDNIFSAIGWASDEEKGFCARVQAFERGFAVHSSPVASCTAGGLYNWATSSDWKPLLLVANNTLRLEPDALSGQNSPAEESERSTRPARHGTLFAMFAGSPPTFDANFSEWPTAWQPLNTIVYDEGQYSGPADLQGTVQAAWSQDGLLLAIRVNDDEYGPGPEGTDMWQGDGIEIHFDRLLPDDYDQWDVNEDDYQIGVSFGQNLDQIGGYRWLPYAEESPVALAGAVRPLEQGSAYRGYNAELLIPWGLFGVDGSTVSAGDRFGFNVSLNDNDGIAPRQQTTLSFSPARTTHDNPTEWGTLVLTQ